MVGSVSWAIPAVIDRLLQQAVVQVLNRIYEPRFVDNSYGFRPQRSAHQALLRACRYYNEGYKVVVDLDMKQYFDTVNHDELMAILARDIHEPMVLRLIRRFLTSGIMVNQLFIANEQGTPQGGNLSPLLANIYLNEFDQLLKTRGHKFVRYADIIFTSKANARVRAC
ncbi:reverse transcriptase domain-containing protein [Loigolactobacillus coryniformis]|uniref:reverse transcriptase domain-containing protein n=1 Tax=Loigolactobacillus coryniformis TaxID=1610 RepID=UPI001F010DCD|nr:reverse transcriptase domain-containing protein [Loigolactobacillus coryniformis]